MNKRDSLVARGGRWPATAGHHVLIESGGTASKQMGSELSKPQPIRASVVVIPLRSGSN
jgi:hypothetical protein